MSPAVAVFLGPTLSADRARLLLPSALVHPPARQGDVYRITHQGPAALLIIDGVFDQELAVWHKEILWALAQGVRVYGSASMGALRAAELDPFGMVGVGEIFQAFADGTFEDDDEVAVAHGSAADGYRAMSEAMVDIRATLQQAEHEGVIAPATTERLVGIGKALFYPQRSLAAILARDAAHRSAPDSESARLARWLTQLPGGRIERKRLDAEAALRRVAADAPVFAEPAPPRFRFEYTEAWHEFRRQAALHPRK